MRTRNQVPNHSQIAASVLDSPQQLSPETGGQKSLQNPENSDQKSDVQDQKPLTRSTRQSTQQLQETKAPASLIKDNRSQGGQSGTTLSELRSHVTAKNSEAANLHQIQESKPNLDSEFLHNQKNIEKTKTGKTITSSTSKNNRKTQPTTNQRETTETTKSIFEGVLDQQHNIEKSTLKTSVAKRDKHTPARKGESAHTSILQDFSAQKHSTTDKKAIMPYSQQKSNLHQKKVDISGRRFSTANHAQSQQSDAVNGQRELLGAEVIEMGDVQSISASQNNNSKRRKGPQGLAINLQARKRIKNQLKRRQDQTSDDIRQVGKADSRDADQEDDKAFWALFALFLKCHINENKDVKYDSNSSLPASQETAIGAPIKAKHGERTLDQKRKGKAKSKRQQPQDEHYDAELQEANQYPENNEEFNSREFYIQQIQNIENELVFLQEIHGAWSDAVQIQNMVIEPNQQLDQDNQQLITQHLNEAKSKLLEAGIIDQNWNYNCEMQQLNEVILQKLQYRQQLYDRYQSIETEMEDAEQVRQYLMTLNDQEQQEKLVDQLHANFQLDAETEMLIREKIQQMGIDVENLIQTQPFTYNLFKILIVSSTNQEDVEKDEGLRTAVQTIRGRQQEEATRQYYTVLEENLAIEQQQQQNQAYEENNEDYVGQRNQVFICKYILQQQQEDNHRKMLIEATRQGLIQFTPSGEILFQNQPIIEYETSNQNMGANQGQPQPEEINNQEAKNSQQQAALPETSQFDATPDMAQNNATLNQDINSELQASAKRDLLQSVQLTTNKQIEQMQELLKSDTDRKREILLSSARGGVNSARPIGTTDINQRQDYPAEISHFQTHINQEERSNDDVVQNTEQK